MTLTALLACALMTVNCAGSPAKPLAAAPPRLELPAAASTPCSLFILPDHPTEADLDLAYATRGADLVSCDAARRLAVETFQAQAEMQAKPNKSRGRVSQWLFKRLKL